MAEIRKARHITDKSDIDYLLNLTEDDLVLFLVSGGGSSLFESPVCPLSELSSLTESLLRSGADIGEINAVRKHISKAYISTKI